MKTLWAAIGIIALLLTGCRQTPVLPQFPLASPEITIESMQQRELAITHLEGDGTLTLTRPDGQSVRLEMAVVAEFPGRLRLRAWKFSQAVFDLTLLEDEVWILVADASRREQILPAGAGAADLMRGWATLQAGFFRHPDLRILQDDSRVLILERPYPTGGEGAVIRAEIDRSTRTIRRHQVRDALGNARFELNHQGYRLLDDIPWAMRLRATSEVGEILLHFRQVRLNLAPPENAFVPPRRAEKLP